MAFKIKVESLNLKLQPTKVTRYRKLMLLIDGILNLAALGISGVRIGGNGGRNASCLPVDHHDRILVLVYAVARIAAKVKVIQSFQT